MCIRDSDDFTSLTVDEHPVLGPQGHTLVDVRVSLHIMDELPDHPLVGAVSYTHLGPTSTGK